MAGQRIDDHSFWAGKGGKDSVFPDGPHKTRSQEHSEGFGALSHYEDTNEEIVRQQKMNSSKVHGHPQKPLHRN